MNEQASLLKQSPWPHRLAVALALVTLPLIGVGGLVTTYDAGMAVPDWPGTYGYNLFLYPLSTWWSGPWDLFVEHGHRLLGAIAGMLTIGFVIAVWLGDSRRWMRDASLAALALVIFQGVLGGLRVRLDERMMALVHGCTGPLFFALSVCLVEMTSRCWRQAAVTPKYPAGRRFARNATLAACLAYLQLTVGAVLRHIPLSAPPQVFRAALLFHLVLAGVLVALVVMISFATLRGPTSHSSLRIPAAFLSLLVLTQVLLGATSYVMKYSWPAWMDRFGFAASYVVQERSFSQGLVVTGHVLCGSLILATLTLLSLRASRQFAAKTASELGSNLTLMRAAA
ncbi:MAG: COX15/CtaA family protein [Pirellulaceae bacterium]